MPHDNYDPKELELFIREELSQHGEWLCDRFAEAIEKGRNVDTGELLDSLSYTPAITTSDGSTAMDITFNTYGRLAEIQSRRRKKEGSNASVWGKKNHRPKRVAWYNKNKYKGYGRLVARLSAGISDDELQRLRGIITEARERMQANN